MDPPRPETSTVDSSLFSEENLKMISPGSQSTCVSPSVPEVPALFAPLPPALRHKIQKSARARMQERVEGYISQRMNVFRVRDALAETYKLTFQRLNPELTPFRNHNIAANQQLFQDPRPRLSPSHFLTSPDRISSQLSLLRKARRMTLANLLKILETMFVHRKKLNWLFMYIFREDEFDFAVATELFEVLNKRFQLEKKLEQLDRISDESEKISRTEAFRQEVVDTVISAIREYFEAEEEPPETIFVDEFEMRKLF